MLLGCPIVHATIEDFRWNDTDTDLWRSPWTLRVSQPFELGIRAVTGGVDRVQIDCRAHPQY